MVDKIARNVKLNAGSNGSPDMCNDAEQLAVFVRTITDIINLAEDNPQIRQRVYTLFLQLNQEYQKGPSMSSKQEVERKIKQYEECGRKLPMKPLEIVKSVAFSTMKRRFLACDPNLDWKRVSNVRSNQVYDILDKNKSLWEEFFHEFDKKLGL